MDTITPLMREVLDSLDTCERGAGDTEIGAAVYRRCGSFYNHEELLSTLVDMLDADLIAARLNEWPQDASISADPIIYDLTDSGCDALWALQKAERAPVYVHPVAFAGHQALVEFMRSLRP